MADLLFYQKVVSLNLEDHGDLCLSTQSDYRFTAGANAVPLVVAEFFEAAKYYPIIFAPNAEGVIMPLALLGLRSGENVFVGEDGGWTVPYVPAFVRRYPFAPAGSAARPEQFTVCIDESSPLLSKEGGERLFDDQGNVTDCLRNAMKFLEDFQKQTIRTAAAIERFAKHGLLREADAVLRASNEETLKYPGVRIVDEQARDALSDEAALELFRAGELAAVYAHQASLSNFGRLIERRASAGHAESLH